MLPQSFRLANAAPTSSLPYLNLQCRHRPCSVHGSNESPSPMTFPLHYCLALVVHVPLFAWRLLLALPAAGWRQLWKRLPLFLLLILCFALLNLLHALGWLLDELFFRRWHKVRVHKAVFIVGLPRSGTTHLQRVLAHDPQFTTFTTWEALLAPTLCEKYCWRAQARQQSF